VEIGDQFNASFLQHLHSNHGPFHVILDDCSHNATLTIESFKNLFPLLSNRGVYIIEDAVEFRDHHQYFYNLTKTLYRKVRHIYVNILK
jgi:spermidine synthase